MFILPINRDTRPARTPWTTWVLIVINSILWVAPTLLGINNRLIQEYGYRPGAASCLTIFASMFLHTGLLHLAGNMWFFWMFAPKIENRVGSLWFAVAYLFCGLGGQGLHTLLSRGSLIPCVGASGAISGIAGMYFLLYPRSPFDLVLYFGWWIRKSFQATTRGAVGTWIGEQFVLGFIFKAMGSAGGGIAFWAHVGGFASGLLCAAMLLPKTTAEEREMILRPQPLSEEEKDEIFADRIEKPSDLTTLKLNG